MYESHRRRFILLASVLSAIALSPSLQSQVIVEGDEDEPSAIAPDTGVYVSESAIVTERVTLAERMERSSEWGKAADILQEVIEKNGQRIVPAKGGDEGPIKQYIGATDLIQRRLAKWPADGLTAYNARYAHVAQGLLDGAPFDPAVLGKVENDYFVTDAGKTAALRRIDIALEAGDFASAAWTVDRLLSLHPTLGDGRPAVLLRAGLAHHLAGDAAPAKAALDELSAKFPQATATIAGQDVIIVDALKKALAEPVPVASIVTSDSWPMLGGGPSRGRVPHTVGQPGARMFGIPLPSVNQRNVLREQRFDLRGRPEQELPGVMPVVDRGELFFQDGQRIYGVSVDSGVTLSGWTTTYPSTNGRYVMPQQAPTPSPRGRQLNTTVTDSVVLAVLGQTDRRTAMATGQFAESRLVCLDRTTGAQRWIGSTATLADDAIKSLVLGGSPLVVGDNVYVTGRSGKQQNFEDCYVVCFNLADGKAKWASYISGASDFNPNFGEGIISDNEAHIAYVGGRLFVSTNLGAVAALDAYGGGLLWLTTYPRGGGDAGRGPLFNQQMNVRRMRMNAAQNNAPPWAYNPPIVRDGRIFILPTDGRDLLVVDAGTGAIERRILARDIENLDTLVGITPDNSIILAGNVELGGSTTALVLGIDWQKYDPRTFKKGATAEPAITLRRPFVAPPARQRSGDTQSLDAMRGRPLLTDGFVYVPTGARLYCLNLKTRMLDDKGTYPAYPRIWDPQDESGEGPGNVLIVGDHVVLAGTNRVDGYTDLTIARAKYDAREAASPNDPEPRLIYAEVMFAAGDVPTALSKLDEAARLLGGPGNLRSGPLRDRLFNDALSFATRLNGTRVESATTTEQASTMFDRAAIAAAAPEQQVAWRTARAKFFLRTRDFNNAVRMYQEILLDESMRAVASFDAKDGPTTAGAAAETAIAAIVNGVGPSCYVAYELVAEEKFNIAKTTNDTKALLAVARSYPNARVAIKAMATAASAYESAGDNRLAGHVLRQAMRRTTDASERTTIVEAMARNYLLIPGGRDLAIGRLTKAVRPDNDPKITTPMKLADGTQLSGSTFMAVLDELRRRPVDVESSSTKLPDLRLSGKGFDVDPITGKKRSRKAFLPAQPQDVTIGVASLLIPPEDLSRNDRVVGWTGTALAVYAVGGKEIATFKEVDTAPRGVAWVADGDLLVWSETDVWRLSPDQKTVVWQLAIGALPTLPALPGGDGNETDDTDEIMQADALQPPPFRVLNGRPAGFGRAMAERVAIARPDDDANARESLTDLHPNPTRIVLLTSGGRLASIDPTDGKLAWQVRLADRGPDRLVSTDEFIVARAANERGSSLLIVDTFSGHVLARRRFSPEQGGVLTNFALGADGTLVYTLAEGLATKDLFDSWDGAPPNERMAEGGPGNVQFSGAVRPDQLIVNDGLAAALSSGGMVRVYSLLTQREHQGQLSVGSSGNDWDVSMRMIGSQLYTVAPRAYGSFDLVNPGPPETQLRTYGTPEQERLPTFRKAMFGKRHVVLLDTMGQGNAEAPVAAVPSYRIWAFNRERVNGIEDGSIDHLEIITDKAGITDWQPLDGGAVYHTADGKLHWLKGGAK